MREKEEREKERERERERLEILGIICDAFFIHFSQHIYLRSSCITKVSCIMNASKWSLNVLFMYSVLVVDDYVLK